MVVESVTPTDWEIIRMTLGIPPHWRLRPKNYAAGYWKLTATASPPPLYFPLECGHLTMQVTATTLAVAVAKMAARLRFHQRHCYPEPGTVRMFR